MPYSQEDADAMGRIADATAADAKAKIVELLNDEEFGRRLVIRLMGEPGARVDPAFEDQVYEFITCLDFLRDELCGQA